MNIPVNVVRDLLDSLPDLVQGPLNYGRIYECYVPENKTVILNESPSVTFKAPPKAVFRFDGYRWNLIQLS